MPPNSQHKHQTSMDSYYTYSSTSTFFFADGDYSDHPSIQIPIQAPSTPASVEIPVQTPTRAAAAAKIQAAFRSRLVRNQVRAIRAADAEASRLERLLRRQETVDAVRRDPRERARFSEALMAALLRLDAVPGYYPAVREARRAVSRRVVGIQEVFDAILAAPEADADGIPASLEQVVAGIWGDSAAPVMPSAAAGEEMWSGGGACWGRFLWGV